MLTPAILDTLPASLRQTIAALPEHQKLTFEEDFMRKRKSVGAFLAIAILFPIQHFLLGKTGLGILFVISCLLLIGSLWYIFEIFYTPFKRIPEYNENLARSLIRDISAAQAIQSFKAQ